MERKRLKTKTCPKCKIIKTTDQYHKDNSRKDGIQYYCKECNKEERKIRTKTKPEMWAKNNPKKSCEKVKRWAKKNRKKVTAYMRTWREKNKERNREIRNAGFKRRMEKPIFRTSHAFSTAMRKSLKGQKQGNPWEKCVGYGLAELVNHLEKQFKDGMSWTNYGQWQIDHIIPVSAFNFETIADIDFTRCWALKNLKPLWKKENQEKHTRITKPFQPALLIGLINA